MPILRRNAKPLLRTVGNKRHAGDEDHEDCKPPSPKKHPNRMSELIKRKEENEKAITASPQSSDNELALPPAPRTRTPRRVAPPLETPDAELKRPKTSASTRTDRRELLEPLSASVKADVVKNGRELDKENEPVRPASSSTSGQDGFQFGMRFSSQGSNKVKRSYGKKQVTRNIHVPPRKVNTKPARAATTIPPMREKNKRMKSTSISNQDDDSDSSDVSMKSIIVEHADDKELRRKKSHAKCSRVGGNMEEIDTARQKRSQDELERGEDLEAPSKTLRSARLLGRLGSWMESKEPTSSQTFRGLDDLNEYIRQLPNQEEGTVCTLCKDEVQLEDYWEFWKGKDQTVKNHTAFCFAHRKKSARAEYVQRGYPEINWSELYERIRMNRSELSQVLYNQRTSQFWERYEPLALTGKAAAVPSRRRDLPKDMQEELESYALDDQSTYPGYYGPHGRRVITEHVMKIFKNEIKNCKNAVVQSSGPAAFVQAVLVPEAAVLLIMDDCKVNREEAEDIREQTYEMGTLLNEEVEDEVELQHDSEGENDYVH